MQSTETVDTVHSVVAQAQTIVFGFIKSIQPLLPSNNNTLYIIPKSIIMLILFYVENIFNNQGTYTWKIDDIHTVEKMLHAKNGEKFESPSFVIARLNCKLAVFPNGDNEDIEGYFVIYLQLLSLPSNVISIRFGRTFRVLECKAAASWLSIISTEMHDFWTRKAPLSELLALNPKTITVQVDLNIFKVMLETIVSDPFKNCLLIQISKKYPLKQYLHYKFEKDDMDIFRKSINGKSMCTKMLNEMWCIQIYPFGVNASGAGYISLFLQLLSFPQNIDKIKVKYKIKCHELDELYEDTDDFDEANFSSWGVDYFIRSSNLYKFETVTFSVDIEILEMFPKQQDPLEVWDQAQIAYILSS